MMLKRTWEVWQVIFGNQPVCEFYVYIQVQ